MSEYFLKTDDLKAFVPKLKVGDKVYLSGIVYTSRDAAHKRIFELIKDNKALPYKIDGSVIYYAGPTPTPNGMAIGSCGPTTSSRMDKFAPKLYDMGLAASIGKGERNQDVIDAIIRNKSVYLCAIGGAGALASKSIISSRVIAFDDLGCESVKELIFNDFPLIVGIDCNGENIFNR
ncbi:MAG: FumA C-terminus/TtdB family hydratase beta subunit [Clostridia bacterium]|nr:FumA C-terminus/TtdB family hydratase beta subunit [Clostridia bacterium]